IDYPQGGGLFWLYLNWALGLRAIGCRVTWIEACRRAWSRTTAQAKVDLLKARLERYDAMDALAVTAETEMGLATHPLDGSINLRDAGTADLLLNFAYRPVPNRDQIRKTAFVDIDPALAQIWISEGQLTIEDHDIYYTIGETVGRPGTLFPDCGL